VKRREDWSKHDRAFWLERSEDPVPPLWFRVTALAYAFHPENGHAHFERGDICKRLARVDFITGELIKTSTSAVNNAIRTAINYRLLDAESLTSRLGCLVVPMRPDGLRGYVWGSNQGSPFDVCDRHRTSPISEVSPPNAHLSVSQPHLSVSSHRADLHKRERPLRVFSPTATRKASEGEVSA
jgi:hypothetical protein